MSNPKTIKTSCGIDKYHQLRRDRSLLGKLSLIWFVVIATLRDFDKWQHLGLLTCNSMKGICISLALDIGAQYLRPVLKI